MTAQSNWPGPPPDEPGADSTEDATVITLLRAATETWPAGRAAVKERVRAEWLAALAGRRRRRRPALVALATAAAAAFGALGWLLLRETLLAPRAEPQTGASLARVERVVAIGEEIAGDQPLLRLDGRVAGVGQTVSARQRVETSSKAVAALRAGRTSIRLDAGTRLRLVSPRRIELQQGAVYLDTPPGDGTLGGGFEVIATAGSVREVGTQFEVRIEADALRVRVREGAVQFAGRATAWRVEAHQELRARRDGEVRLAAIPAAGEDWAWVSRAAPPPALEGRTLSELLAWVSRETGATVVFEDELDEALEGKVKLHGALEDLDPESAVALVLPACGLRGRFEGGLLLIERP